MLGSKCTEPLGEEVVSETVGSADAYCPRYCLGRRAQLGSDLEEFGFGAAVTRGNIAELVPQHSDYDCWDLTG
jgi:hypothetical protein